MPAPKVFFTIGLLISILNNSGCSLSLISSAENCSLRKVEKRNDKVLLFVAHQDDDVFIISRLRQHISFGDSIFVVWTTSSQGESKYSDPRVMESMKAMELLGVPLERCIYFRFPDGETYKYVDSIITQLKIIISNIQPRLIYIPAFEGGHVDHDIANFSVVQAIKELNYSCEIMEFPIYNAVGIFPLLPFAVRSLGNREDTQCRILSDDEYQFVLDYWYIYQSQQYPLDPYIRATTGYWRAFGIEYVRELPMYDYTKPSFVNSVAYERFLFGVHLEDYLKAAESAMTKIH